MNISNKQKMDDLWPGIILFVLLVVILIAGIINGLTSTQIVIDVVALGTGFLQVKPNLWSGLLGKMKITLSQKTIEIILRIITIVLLMVAIILLVISFFTRTSIPVSGSQFLAVGEAGTVLTSSDGRNWTTQASGSSKNLQGRVFGDELS